MIKLFIIIVLINYINSQCGGCDPNYPCSTFDSFQNCKDANAMTACAWCYPTGKCYEWDVCGNHTNPSCNNYTVFSSMSCSDLDKEQKIIIIVVTSSIGGSLVIAAIAGLIYCLRRQTGYYHSIN